MRDSITIGLVDDHQMFLDGLLAVVSAQENMQVLWAENSAKNALVCLEKALPDIIITDISMPEMNGIEFVKHLKKEYPTVKILAMSMFNHLHDLEGIDGYLLKETDKKELITALEKIVWEDATYFGVKAMAQEKLVFNKSILSQREKEIVKLIYEELTTEQIAEKLFVSKHTIETHKKNIFLKLQIKNTAGLIKKAIQLGVV